MKRLCLIIPTYNRPASIQAYLTEQAQALRENEIDLILYDSSEGDASQKIAERFIASGFSNIKYERYTGEQETMAIDKKVFSACKKYAPQYDYVWFSSDGTLIDISMLFGTLQSFLDRDCDLIVFDNYNYMGFSYREYTDCRRLFHDCCWRMTSLSAIIASGGLLQKAIRIFPVSAKDNYGLWLPMAYLRTIASEPFHAVYFVKENSWKANPMRNDSFWKLSGNTLWQWGEIWCQVIDALPSVFDTEKEYVLKSHDRYTKIFSVRNLISLKASDNLSFNKLMTYRGYIPKVTNTKLFWFYSITLLLNKHFAAQCKTLYRRLKPRKIEQ